MWLAVSDDLTCPARVALSRKTRDKDIKGVQGADCTNFGARIATEGRNWFSMGGNWLVNIRTSSAWKWGLNPPKEGSH